MTTATDELEAIALAISRACDKQFDPPAFLDWEPIARAAQDEVVKACSRRLLELSEQRPSPGLVERQGVTEDAIKYGQAILRAASDDLLKRTQSKKEPKP